MQKKFRNIGLLSLITILGACNSNDAASYSFDEVENEKIGHLHGLGYPNGEDKMVIATHEGYKNRGEES
jgi:hypothetical protein